MKAWAAWLALWLCVWVVCALEEHGPITISLKKHENKNRRAAVLLALKLRQIYPALVEEVPLDQEILEEKHLATYFGTIKIGGTEFRVLFDTGSCEFWVPASSCQTDRCKQHRRFPIDSVKAAEVVSKSGMNIQYLSGKVQGEMVKEVIELGDIKVHNQVVGLANTVDIELLDDVVWDGILGLAYPNQALTNQGVVPLFDTIMKEKTLTSRKLSNQFAYYIDDEKGAVTFGGANCDLLNLGQQEKNCIKRFNFIPVTEKTYWTVQIKDVQIQYPGAPVKSGYCSQSGGCKAIVDTGTYLIYGPENQVSQMVSQELKSCEHHRKLPTFTFLFDVGDGKEVKLHLKPTDYILKFEINDAEECVVGISPDKDTIWTLGQVFLRSFYTVFDRDQDRIGFARLPRPNFVALNAHKKAGKNR